jgi:tetratricopeptide (TPR) repeat protein
VSEPRAVAAAPAVAELAFLLGGPETGRAEAGLRAILLDKPANGLAARSLISHLIGAGRAPEAVDLARAHLTACETRPQRKPNLARLLLAEALAATNRREAAQVAPTAEDLGAVWSAQLRRAELMIRLARFDEAVASCRAARIAMPAPATGGHIVRLAKLAKRAGDLALAADWIGEAMGPDIAVGGISSRQRTILVNLRVDSLVALRRYAEAYEALEQAAATSEDTRLETQALWLARYHGDAEMMVRARDQQNLRGRQRLPTNLASGLAAIEIPPAPPLTAAPERMLVPWEAAALAASEWPAWASRHLWGGTASKLLVDWLQFAGEDRQDQLAALLLPVEDDSLRRALGQGRGVIIAGTHLGPIAAAFPYLLRLPSKLAVVGGGGTEIGGVEGIFVPRRGRAGAIRAVRQRLQQCGVAMIAIDMVLPGGGALPLEIGGRTLLFSSLVAKLSRALSVPSVWLQPEWRENQIHLRMAALPEAGIGEEKRDWERRWFDVSSRYLLDFLRTCSPESASGLRLQSAERSAAANIGPR